ncbi:hypothetical protein RYX36_001768, partial [Vicia faba]
SIHQELACLIWAIAEHIDIEGLDPLLADNPDDPFNVIVSNIHKNYERRGGLDPISSQNAKPPGVELWAAFDVPQHQVDASWKNLTHSLSGILCSSITFLESSNAYSSPKRASKSTLGNLRYGTFLREVVCKENIIPWLKLLPCRDKAKISALVDIPSIYRSFYHSQRLHLTVSTAPADELDSGIILEQTLTFVLQPDILKTSSSFPDEFKIQPSWSLSSIFGRKVNGRCVLPKSSNVYFHVERDLVAQLEKLQKNTNAYADNGMGLTWKYRVVWSCPLAPLYAGRILIGSGNERGSIAISFKSKELTKGFNVANNVEEKCKLQVYVLQIVPLYIKVYYHTL